jgi:hypothetical protein
VFHLAVRLLGLVFLYHALMLAPSALSRLLDLFYGSSFLSVVKPLLPIAVHLVAACWLFLGAPPLTRAAYPDDPDVS